MKTFVATLIGAGLLTAVVYQTTNAEASRQAAPNPQIERGRYVVDIAGCNDCHTKGFAEAGGKAAQGVLLTGDTLGYRGPWGTTYPTNLRLTIGKMTEEQWLKYAKSLNTRPPMPWFNVRAMNDADLRALWQYVRSLGSGGTSAPAFIPPDKQPPQPYIQWPGVK